MVKQTPEQLKASDPTSSVWVGASAGTGKTFVLSNRVLRLMLAGSRPEKILCLTYTKTAAAEMAIRVNSRLSSWITMQDRELAGELENILGCAPDADQMLLARKLFAKVLDVPGGLKIQTIHSFCQSLLGRFPIEADIAPNFDLLDDITISQELGLAQDELLIEIADGGRDALSRALEQISGMLAEETFTDLMRSLAHERGDIEKMIIRNSSSFKRMICALRDLLELEEDDTRDSIITAACEEGNFAVSDLKKAGEILKTGKKTDQNRGALISDWIESQQRIELFAQYKLAFLTAKDEPRASLITKSLNEEHPELLDILQKESDRIKFVTERLRTYSLFENTSNILRIGYELIRHYNARKTSRNVVDYDDLIAKVSHLLHNVSASWILYKLDEGIDHILIDEAQDTNPIQWEIIRKISDEFFSGLGTRDELENNPRTIFAVGDIKQSIYSFQKAEPKKFHDNKEYFIERAEKAELKFSEVPMNLSFRSTSAVLEVVDSVFSDEAHRQAISFARAEIMHDTHRSGEAGLIEIWPPVLPQEGDVEEGWTPPVLQKPSEDPKRVVAEQIADQIKKWIDDGKILPSKGRAICAGDILILVQKRKSFVHYMISALKNRGVNVAGLDQMVLTDQLAVMDLIAVADFTLLPSDDLTLAVVLKGPFIGMSEDDLFELAHARGRNDSLWRALLKRRDERRSFADAAEILTQLTDYADFHPPFEFFSYLLGAMNGREKLISRLGEQINDPVDEFLNQAMKYEQNNISSMQGFLSWTKSGEIKIKRDMEQGGDMVRIMTVHGAKGLQAPIVFLPDTCQVPVLNERLFWHPPESSEHLLYIRNEKTRVGPAKQAYDERKREMENENKRLLYVAMTRAEDQLFVTGWEDKHGRKDGNWYDLIRNAVAEMDDADEFERDGELILRREKTGPVREVETEKIKAEVDKVSVLPSWAQRPPAPEPSPSRPLSPSRPSATEEVVRSPLQVIEQQALDKQKFHRGRLIHKLLELLPVLAGEDREAAAVRYLSQDAHELQTQDISDMTEEVMTVLENEELRGLFDTGSRAEVPIVGQVGNYTLSGQVDRLAVRDDEVLIIDFKTNRPPPKGAAAIPHIYQKQMAAYREVLGDIYPEKTVRCFLLWTDICSLMEIPEDMLEKIEF